MTKNPYFSWLVKTKSFSPCEAKMLLSNIQKAYDNGKIQKIDYKIWKEIKKVSVSTSFFVTFKLDPTDTNNIKVLVDPNKVFEINLENWSSEERTNLYEIIFDEKTITDDYSNIKIDITERDNDMTTSMNKNIFGNFDFGSCANYDIRASIYGLAIANTNGEYVSYNKATNEIVNVEAFAFDGGNFFFRIPVGISQVKIGDVIIHNRVPIFVTQIVEEGNKIVGIDPRAGEEKTVLLTKSPFGFNFCTKIVNLFDSISSSEANADNPFGEMLPFMMMANADDENSNAMLPLMLMAGNKDFAANPIMLMAMCNGNMNMNNPMMLYLMMNLNK